MRINLKPISSSSLSPLLLLFFSNFPTVSRFLKRTFNILKHLFTTCPHHNTSTIVTVNRSLAINCTLFLFLFLTLPVMNQTCYCLGRRRTPACTNCLSKCFFFLPLFVYVTTVYLQLLSTLKH